MPPNPDSGVATATASNEKPFSFLQLPPESRNHVNQSLLIDSKDSIKLRHETSAIGPTTGSFFALTAVCKQTRAEFRPMLAKSYKEIEIRLKNLFKFFETFSARPFRPKRLHIRVQYQDVTREFKWDMRPFFAFKSSPPRGHECYISGPNNYMNPLSRTSDYDEVIRTLSHAKNISRAFRADLQRGYVSNVTYELKHNHLQLWTLTISKHSIGLQPSEVEALTRYCEYLCFRKEPNKKIINIKVHNHRQRVFEEYMWVRTNYMKHLDGFDQPDWEHRLWEKIGNAPWKAPGFPEKPKWWDW